jgi:hypothetical protein
MPVSSSTRRIGDGLPVWSPAGPGRPVTDLPLGRSVTDLPLGPSVTDMSPGRSVTDVPSTCAGSVVRPSDPARRFSSRR